MKKTSVECRLFMNYCFVSQSKRDRGELSKSVKELVIEADRLEVKEKVPLVLVELLLTDKVLTQIKEHRILFLSVSSSLHNLFMNETDACTCEERLLKKKGVGWCDMNWFFQKDIFET